ncbi:MAG TPA: hypothetical protein VFX96_01765 [Pyrinomonadaceae bacterium]|nr:hypothetical protein [Pyrinomonadaceae bacterium]
MSLNRDDLRERNTVAIKALELSVMQLRKLRKGKTLTIRKRYQREIARAIEEITDLELINGHLKASDTTVEPMSASVQSTLDDLAGRLDEAIRSDFILNAAFETVLDVISFAEEIGAIVDSHVHA